jgi:glutathione peroxidase
MSIYEHSALSLAGEDTPLAQHRGEVLLIVNTASQCGFTGQYQGLEALYRRFKDQGFCVLGFPCNQFGAQEPGDAAEIQTFCQTTYDVTFPLFAKVDVNGPSTHPLFAELKKAQKGVLGSEAVKWNFTKFLVDRSGEVRRRFGSMVKPEEITTAVQELLAEPAHGR